MKTNIFAAIVATAALTAQVGASPIRVVVVTNGQVVSPVQDIRFGHGVPAGVATIPTFAPDFSADVKPALRRPCSNRLRNKAIQISNAFRQALGLPLIEDFKSEHGDYAHGKMLKIIPFMGTSPTFIEPGNVIPVEDRRPFASIKMQEGPRFHPHPHRHYHNLNKWDNTFWVRMHRALMALGPWEGRAVAFILGCGIGVILRMFWVLTVVTYRSIRGGHNNEYTQYAVIEEYVDAEDIVVPPPTYTIRDEKEQIKVKDTTED